MSENLKRKAESLEHDAKTKFKEVANDLVDDFVKLGNTAREMASDSLGNAQDQIASLYQEGQKKVTALEGKMEKRMKAHPIETILIAAGAGFILGWLKGKR